MLIKEGCRRPTVLIALFENTDIYTWMMMMMISVRAYACVVAVALLFLSSWMAI